MSANRPSPPPGAGKAAQAVVTIIGLVILVVFVGFNMQHASDQKTGHVDPAGVPKSSTDLQAAPSQHK